MSAVDAEAGREQTLALIDQNPVSIVLRRRLKVADGAGGFVPEPSEIYLPTQRGRLVRQSSSTRYAVDGHERVHLYTLVLPPEGDVLEGDVFDLDGRDYEVLHVHESRLWSTRAEVSRRG